MILPSWLISMDLGCLIDLRDATTFRAARCLEVSRLSAAVVRRFVGRGALAESFFGAERTIAFDGGVDDLGSPSTFSLAGRVLPAWW